MGSIRKWTAPQGLCPSKFLSHSFLPVLRFQWHLPILRNVGAFSGLSRAEATTYFNHYYA